MIDVDAILFDLDGTLLDTAPDMVGALNRLLGENGREPLELGAARAFVSHGAARLVRLGFADASAELFERLRQRFLAIYADHVADATRLFVGIEEVLVALEASGKPWGVVTNKPGWLTDPLMIEVNLHKRARAVVSGDTLPERKPHPLPLLHAAKTLGVDPRHCVYVGDAERDMQAAKAAGMYALVAGFGYLGDDDRADTWFSHGWLHTPLELIDWLDKPRNGSA